MQTSYIQFHDNVLTVVTDQAGQQFVAVRPICDALGIQHQRQNEKLGSDPRFNRIHMATVGPDGRIREMSCIPLSQVNGWLYTINVNKVLPQAREKLLTYQRECQDVLFRHFMPNGTTSELMQLMTAFGVRQLRLEEHTEKLDSRVARLEEENAQLKPSLQLSASAAGTALYAHKHTKKLRSN